MTKRRRKPRARPEQDQEQQGEKRSVVYVDRVQFPTLHGRPDGTIAGDVDALLIENGPLVIGRWSNPPNSTLPPQEEIDAFNAAERAAFDQRRAILTDFLTRFERDKGSERRRALVRALWPHVRALSELRATVGLHTSTRVAADRRKHTDPATVMPLLEEIIVQYRSFDAVAEPATALLRGFERWNELRGGQAESEAVSVPTRLSERGNPELKLVQPAKAALRPFVNRRQATALLKIVGLLLPWPTDEPAAERVAEHLGMSQHRGTRAPTRPAVTQRRCLVCDRLRNSRSRADRVHPKCAEKARRGL